MRGLALAALIALGTAAAAASGSDPGARPLLTVIVSRHGLRSPTWTDDRLSKYSAEPWPKWDAAPGNLTEHGRQQMTLLGAYYRARLIADGSLDTTTCQAAAETYIAADNAERTVESGRAISAGLLPGCSIEIHSRPTGEHDALFEPLDAGNFTADPAVAAAVLEARLGPDPDAIVRAHRQAFERLDAILAGPGHPELQVRGQPMTVTTSDTGVSLNGPLSTASTLTEDLLLEYGNAMSGSALGWGRMTAADLEAVMSLHTAYAELARRTPYLATIGASNLLWHITRTLQQAADGGTVNGAVAPQDARVVVLVGHDTNLSNLSGLLGLSWQLPSYQADDVPPGGALIFTLWPTANGGRSLQLQFVSQTLDEMRDLSPLSLANPPAVTDVFVPGCGTARPGLACEWSQFEHLADRVVDPSYVR